MRLINILIVVLLTLTACSTQEQPEVLVKESPIAFAGPEVPVSRGGTALNVVWDNFMVWATKQLPDNSSQKIFPGYRVEYSDNAWSYEGIGEQYLKYWDESAAEYVFTAVAPAPDNSESATMGFKNTTVSVDNGEVKIENIIGNLSTGDYDNSLGAPDWMIAKTKRVQSPLADTDEIDNTDNLHEKKHMTTFLDQVPLCFHSLMARTTFKVYSTSTLILSKFTVTVAESQQTGDDWKIITRGDYSSVRGWTKTGYNDVDHPFTLENDYFPDGKTLSTDSENPSLMATHVQIPQVWGDAGRKFKVVCEDRDGNKYEGDIVFNAETHGKNSWDVGVNYIYTIKIVNDGGTNEYILFKVTMDMWKWQPGSNYEDTETNW